LDRDGASSPLGDTNRDGADARAAGGGFEREQQDRQQSPGAMGLSRIIEISTTATRGFGAEKPRHAGASW
jgi:hypothetical protein